MFKRLNNLARVRACTLACLLGLGACAPAQGSRIMTGTSQASSTMYGINSAVTAAAQLARSLGIPSQEQQRYPVR